MAQAVNVLHKDSCGCGKSNDTIEFLCAANPDVYTDLANSYIHVKAKITKANGADLDADEQVGPVNL